MLGNAVFRFLSSQDGVSVVGTIRLESDRKLFPDSANDQLVLVTDAIDLARVSLLLAEESPDDVINCIAPPRQNINDLGTAIDMFALFPASWKLYVSATKLGIHISSDGVFQGGMDILGGVVSRCYRCLWGLEIPRRACSVSLNLYQDLRYWASIKGQGWAT